MRVVRLTNRSRGCLVAARCALAESWWPRAVGLLGRTGLANDEALLLRPCRSVHALGMRFAFDAVLLDAGLTVVDLRPLIRPGTLYVGHRAARAVLECPAGSSPLRLAVGDRLELEY
jgi:uncharacterized membrane protein (UPF0127 family)